MIRLDQVTKAWGPTFAIRDVDLAIPRGAWFTVIGASGSGKTTLLRTINRLVDPDRGRVWVDGRDVATVPPAALRRSIGYVLQGIGLFPHWTVGENVAAVPRLLGWPEDRVRARVEALLHTVGLPGARDRFPDALSGGERQRVGIARALAAEPPILLLDEPFGALDPVTRDRLQGEVRALHDRLGLTTVLVTHDMAEALRLADQPADRIVVLDAGRVIRVGRPRELLADPGPDAVAALLDAPRRHATLLRSLSEPA
ncbi:MAG: ABC transporter ATP-binding protein [Myxococcota bacterium]